MSTKNLKVEDTTPSDMLFNDTTDSDEDFDVQFQKPKKVKNVYNQPSLHDNSSWFNRVTHKWSFGIINRMKNGEKIQKSDLGGLAEADRVGTKLA